MKQQKLLRLLREMPRNSKRSDREIAKRLGVSQPTVNRTRTLLEKDYTRTYTVIPDLVKLGYQILAFTFLKMKSYRSKEEADKILRKAKEWTDKHPNEVFAAGDEGIGKDLVIVSFHDDYLSYSGFTRTLAMEWVEAVGELGFFLVSVASGSEIKPFDLKYLASDK